MLFLDDVKQKKAVRVGVVICLGCLLTKHNSKMTRFHPKCPMLTVNISWDQVVTVDCPAFGSPDGLNERDGVVEWEIN